jgi:hypothetical protein
MRRELFIHLSFWFSFFVFIALVKHLFNLESWPFWAGGLIGTFLPDIDHLIYLYFLRPQELTSQRVGFLVDHKEFKRMMELLYETRYERTGLIFHTIFFQAIFLILTFWVMSSSPSLFGRGLVLAFSLHLSIDEITDLVEIKSLKNWFKFIQVNLDFRQSKLYSFVTFILVCLLGLLF